MVHSQVGPPRVGDIASVYCDPSLALEKLEWKVSIRDFFLCYRDLRSKAVVILFQIFVLQAELGLEEMCRDLWKWQIDNPNGFLAA